MVNSGKIIELKGRGWTLKGGEFWENNIIKGEGMDIRQGGEFCVKMIKIRQKTHLMGVG